jgi:hypothetical protein
MVARRTRHTVAFTLTHPEGSAAEPTGSLTRATTNTRNHVRFAQERWLSEVSDFLELDHAAR